VGEERIDVLIELWIAGAELVYAANVVDGGLKDSVYDLGGRCTWRGCWH
jgi:hypothetical protein